MKKILIIFIGVICIFTLLKVPTLSNQEKVNPFNTLYQIEGIQFSELKVSAWAKINNNSSTKKHLVDILNLLEKEYNIELSNEWERDNNYQSVSSKADLNLDRGIISINIISTPSETYLSINLDDLPMENSQAQRDKLLNIFNYFQVIPAINETAICYLPGYLTVPNQEQIVYSIFDKVNGIIVEGIKDEVLVSYSGFIPGFSDSVEVAGKKININIASRYHNIDDKTYLYMGTPLIHCQY